MLRRHLLRSSLLLLLGWLLVACGQSAATTPTLAPTQSPAEPATTLPATAPPTAQAASAYADIPQGLTSEGYQLLGAPEAPVTLVMYSDFL